MIAFAALAWVVLLALATWWRDRAVQGELDELRARLWALELDADERRDGGA